METTKKIAKTEEVKQVLRKAIGGAKFISRNQWWNWMQPFKITLDGKEVDPVICNRLYREKLVTSEREHAGRIYLSVTEKGVRLAEKV